MNVVGGVMEYIYSGIRQAVVYGYGLVWKISQPAPLLQSVRPRELSALWCVLQCQIDAVWLDVYDQTLCKTLL